MSRPIVINFPNSLANSVAPLQTITHSASVPTAIALNETSQVGTNGSAMVLTPQLVQLTNMGAGNPISFSSTANYSAINITIYGLDLNGNPINETLAGPNNSPVNGPVTSTKYYQLVTTISASAACGGTSGGILNVNFGIDNISQFNFISYQRLITATSRTTNISANFLTLVGTDLLGNVFMETISTGGTLATVTSTQQFATLIMATLSGPTVVSGGNFELGEGISGILAPVRFDYDRNLSAFTVQVITVGTITYTNKITIDELETFIAGEGTVVNQNVSWAIQGTANETTSSFNGWGSVITALRCEVSTSALGSGSLTFTILQQGLVS